MGDTAKAAAEAPAGGRPDEQTASDGVVWTDVEAVRADEVRAVAGRVMTLDRGVSWPRTAAEIVAEWRLLESEVKVLTGPAGIDVRRLDGGGLMRWGVYRAARWALEMTFETPLSGRRRVVSGLSLQEELELANRVMLARAEDWEYAAGVLFWLSWITGIGKSLF